MTQSTGTETQAKLDGMTDPKDDKLEQLVKTWLHAKRIHKEATVSITDAKTDVRKYMKENGYKDGYLAEGLGSVVWEEEEERDIKFQPIKRKKEKPEEE